MFSCWRCPNSLMFELPQQFECLVQRSGPTWKVSVTPVDTDFWRGRSRLCATIGPKAAISFFIPRSKATGKSLLTKLVRSVDTCSALSRSCFSLLTFSSASRAHIVSTFAFTTFSIRWPKAPEKNLIKKAPVRNEWIYPCHAFYIPVLASN